MTTLYGIKNCDTVRKARKWLGAQNIDYQFHDVRSDGLDKKCLIAWVKELGWETLLNTRGTTWRKLSEQQRSNVDEKKAITLMLEQPAMIKRPVLEVGKKYYVGFKDSEYEALFL